MSGDRIARALARIETAARRIGEAAPVSSASDPALSQKYEGLRSETRLALAEIDRLIETLGK